ncbi:hypothetical protein AB0D62_33825 [Streptomyces massasporeus]|uniref:hypothetical protein n=1 Tax=Streptomyces massasporeus TaxID=67324 RepID=UPI0033D9DD05
MSQRPALDPGGTIDDPTLVVLMAFTAGLRQTLGMGVLAGAFLTWLVLYGNLQHRRLRTMREALRARD